MREDRVYRLLTILLGDSIHSWPPFPRRRARWWQVRLRRSEWAIDEIFGYAFGRRFTDEDCAKFHHQKARGQLVTEDAGGFLWRCWSAALGLPFEDGATHAEASAEVFSHVGAMQ